jgi:hypothetical protein
MAQHILEFQRDVTLGTNARSCPLLGLVVDDLASPSDFVNEAALFRIAPLPRRVPNRLNWRTEFHIRHAERLVPLADVQARELWSDHCKVNVAASVSGIAGIRTKQDHCLDTHTPRLQVPNVLIYERPNLGSRSNHFNNALLCFKNRSATGLG